MFKRIDLVKALKILKEAEKEAQFFRNKVRHSSVELEAENELLFIMDAIVELEALIAKDKTKNCEECFKKVDIAIKLAEQKGK